MNEGEFLPDRISEEELRELLEGDSGPSVRESSRADSPAGRDAAADALSESENHRPRRKPRILVLVRRGGEVEVVEALNSIGARARLVRNAFTALDALRADAYDGIVSDLELWAERGRLLQERLHREGLRIPILFLCSGSGVDEDRIRQETGAWRVLARPLTPRQWGESLTELLEVALELPASFPLTAETCPSPLDATSGWQGEERRDAISLDSPVEPTATTTGTPGSADDPADSADERADSADERADSAGEPADSAPDPADSAPDPADSAPDPADSAPDPADPAPDSARGGVELVESEILLGETPWLRFLIAAQRDLRRGTLRPGDVVRGARKFLGADGVALIVVDGGSRRVVADYSERLNERAVSELVTPERHDKITRGDVIRTGRDSRPSQLVLLGLPRAVEAQLANFRDDLGWILQQLYQN